MSIEFVRPYTAPNFERLSAFLDSEEVTLYSSDEDDWREVNLTDKEFGEAMRIMMSLDFDSYISAREEMQYAKDRTEEHKAEIARELESECPDVEAITSLVDSIQYWSDCHGHWSYRAQDTRFKIKTKVSGRVWRNTCNLYSSLYNVCYADIERV